MDDYGTNRTTGSFIVIDPQTNATSGAGVIRVLATTHASPNVVRHRGRLTRADRYAALEVAGGHGPVHRAVGGGQVDRGGRGRGGVRAERAPRLPARRRQPAPRHQRRPRLLGRGPQGERAPGRRGGAHVRRVGLAGAHRADLPVRRRPPPDPDAARRRRACRSSRSSWPRRSRSASGATPRASTPGPAPASCPASPGSTRTTRRRARRTWCLRPARGRVSEQVSPRAGAAGAHAPLANAGGPEEPPPAPARTEPAGPRPARPARGAGGGGTALGPSPAPDGVGGDRRAHRRCGRHRAAARAARVVEPAVELSAQEDPTPQGALSSHTLLKLPSASAVGRAGRVGLGHRRPARPVGGLRPVDGQGGALGPPGRDGRWPWCWRTGTCGSPTRSTTRWWRWTRPRCWSSAASRCRPSRPAWRVLDGDVWVTSLADARGDADRRAGPARPGRRSRCWRARCAWRRATARLWVTGTTDVLTRVTPAAAGSVATATQQKTVTVGQGPIGVATGAGAVWVANSADGTVSKVAPASVTVTQTIRVGGDPLAVGGVRGRGLRRRRHGADGPHRVAGAGVQDAATSARTRGRCCPWAPASGWPAPTPGGYWRWPRADNFSQHLQTHVGCSFVLGEETGYELGL